MISSHNIYYWPSCSLDRITSQLLLQIGLLCVSILCSSVAIWVKNTFCAPNSVQLFNYYLRQAPQALTILKTAALKYFFIKCSTRVFLVCILCIHAYIHNCHYNLSVRIIDIVFRTTYVVRIHFIHKRRGLQFKVDRRTTDFLRNFSWQLYLLSEFLPVIF